MRAAAILLILLALAATVRPAAAARVPQSDRSRAAMARVTPGLKMDLLARGLTLGSPVHLRIFKEEKELEIWMKQGDAFVLFRTYTVCSFGRGGLGPKQKEGDGMAPEGFFVVTPGRFNPFSRFHLSFDVGYPNRYGLGFGRTGGDIMVHGACASIGCFAMTDDGIEEIWTLCSTALNAGQPFFRLHIYPFRMTPANLGKHRRSEWAEFWRNLQEGYLWFENHGHRPPDVRVENRRYTFH
ncbi:MAG: murein L,D-transpeptidase family protein [bacterium]